MNGYIIVFTSLTYVYKAQGILNAANIPSGIVRLGASYSNRGCGYGLEISERFLCNAAKIIEANGIRMVEAVRV